MRPLAILAVLLAVSPVAAQTPQAPQHKHYEDPPQATAPAPSGALAPRLQNLGAHTFRVTTKSRQAQRFIDQGMNLAYGFNHAEAGRSFRESARLDPNLAMAYWGQALVLGPNINVPMSPEDEPRALELVRKAAALKAKASPRERAYIDALARRYTGNKDDRATADRAYADAMRALHARYPAPAEAFPYLRGTWLYARGLALAAKGRLEDADVALAELRTIAASPSLEYSLFSPNTAASILALAPAALAGDLAARRQDYDRAIAHLERAVRLEDGLVYTEPAEYHYPARQLLADVLLQAGRPREAETVYWEDLRRNPENGWSLCGLAKALRAQKRETDAALIDARFKKAWARGDVTLPGSRF